ncbi:zinc metalloprotease [Croceitalea sp. P059]|uniref:zinc metalloprotease n=1 Tax=Croceitalea sp. P059 TaxID=3075601 RepID=UPI0028851DB1|nr:zinc metalloprotease [Croceitalea sp. P059]MDT0538811.1 zinc metalloprotease [Croceitalea sp. P059]
MKKVIFTIAVIGIVAVSCVKEQSPENDDLNSQEVQVDMSDFYVYTDEIETGDQTAKGNSGRECHSMKVLNEKLRANPGLEKKMYDIEFNIRKFIASKKPDGVGNGNGNGNGGGGEEPEPPVDDNLGTITIPVIVHVLYNSAAENISDQQINSQIAVLNADFNASNNDINQVPSLFAPNVGDVDIQFTVDRVIRKSTTRTSFGTNDAIKFNSQGGSDVVTPDTHLNMWIGDIGGGILGYAQFPGGSTATDGVVVGTAFFGTSGTATAPFDGGRTMTHEVGHWLNLRHIWGDGRCNRDDFVSDTPRSDRPNYGCPSYPTTHCRTTDMTMNYMDYVNDDCMYMFTNGQTERMRALFAPGGARDTF